MKTLIVEDDATTRRLLTEVLSERGHAVTACVNAEEGMQQMEGDYFPLILLDVLLPGMNGIDLCRWVRARANGDRPYVLVETVCSQPQDLQAILGAGADDYLPKPYDVGLLKVRLAVAEKELQGRWQRLRAEAERQRLMEELKRQTQRLDGLLASMPGMVWETRGRPGSEEERVQFVSDFAEKMLGYPVGEWLSAPGFWYGILHPEDKVRALQEAQAAFEGGLGGNWQFRWVAKSGQPVWVEVHCAVTRNGDGSPQGLRGVALDITERLNLETQVRQKQKMESIGQLAAGVAHGFNNILTVIKGYTSLLELQTRELPDVTEPLKQIALASDRAADLTRQLLAFSRRQMIRPRPLDLNEIISSVHLVLKRLLGEGIALDFSYASNLPLVQADAAMVEQVLLNLAVNARDAMAKGGRLAISTRPVEIDAAHVRRNPEAHLGPFVCVAVADTGCGMDPLTLSKIFEPFFTTKGMGLGTGLGLASVHGIIKQHRGWIEVTSRVSEGTAFKIFLPADVAAGAGKAPEKAPAPKVLMREERILLVEDEPALRALGRLVLQRAGYDVLEAASGQEALQVWEDQRGAIDLVLTDMVMPDGLTGRELSELILAKKPGVKVIYTSGYTADMVAPDSLLPSGIPFLSKPYNPQALLQAVRKCLDG